MSFWDFLYPKKCVGCGKMGGYLCEKCKVGVWEEEQICPACSRRSLGGFRHKKCHNGALSGVTCVWAYDGLVKKVIAMGKYRYLYDVLREIVPRRETVETREDLVGLRDFLLDKPVLVPVPLSRQRFFERGFNQATVIASELGRSFGLEMKEVLSRRDDDRGHQVGKSRADRLKSVTGSFYLRRSCESENVVIVDDVWTTGATLQEAAITIKRCGVKKVWGFVLGR